jgi:hypothetical protein
VFEFPSYLLNPEFEEDRNLLYVYIRHITAFAKEKERCAASLIEDLKSGLKHHDIHCISLTESFEVLIGINIEEFSNLLEFLQEPLKIAFPHSILLLKPQETYPYSSIRMKLFMFLFRMKNGCSFGFMEGIFGWSSSAIHNQFNIILHVLHISMKDFHSEGILRYLGDNYLQQECISWRFEQSARGHLGAFQQRIVDLNDQAHRSREPSIVEPQTFMGSIGAVDGTYLIGEDPQSDKMYSVYVKMHAYMSRWMQGDNAYHKCKRCIVPYVATEQIQYGNNSDFAIILIIFIQSIESLQNMESVFSKSGVLFAVGMTLFYSKYQKVS